MGWNDAVADDDHDCSEMMMMMMIEMQMTAKMMTRHYKMSISKFGGVRIEIQKLPNTRTQAHTLSGHTISPTHIWQASHMHTHESPYEHAHEPKHTHTYPRTSNIYAR